MLQELHIQSNLPIIILTVLVICAIVLGYLELKKVNNMIDLINNRLDGLKNIKTEEKHQVSDNQKIYVENTQESQQTKNNNMENPNGKQINKIPPKNFDPLSAVMGGLPFGGFMLQTGGQMMPMGFEAKDMKDITEIGLDEDMSDEEKDEIDVMEVEDIDVEKEIFGLENDDNDDNISESSQSYSDSDYSDDEVIDLVRGQGKVEDIEQEGPEEEQEEQEEEQQEEEEEQEEEQEEEPADQSEEEIEIDDSLSVKQLKTICEEMNIPQSGNKSQLIKRIINNKK
jgi:hypothetical protein